MTNSLLSSAATKNRRNIFKKLPLNVAIVGGVFLLLGILWWWVIQPMQHTLELRLQRYSTQLLSIQELNQTLLTYQDKSVKISSLSDNDLSTLQQKLFSLGVKFTLTRVQNTGSVQLDLKIDEIEFSRWLELIEDFRKNNGLYASDVAIKKNERIGAIQVSATLEQVR
jgi:type II secretory pathway component PulM